MEACRALSDLGVKILPQMEARRILGTEWVEAVELSNGSTLSADLCLVAAGIRPNAALAESAGLVVRRGEVVDDRMCTSDPHIFAAGDAVEFGERPLGLWPAAMEQAHAAVVNLLGSECRYAGATPSTRLKVAGIDLLSVGDIEPRGQDGRVVRVDSGDGRQYQKLIVSKGRIRGAILIGHEELADSVAAAVEAQLEVSHLLPSLEHGDWSVLAA